MGSDRRKSLGASGSSGASARYLADVTATLRVLAGVGVVDPSSTALAELMEPAELRLSQIR